MTGTPATAPFFSAIMPVYNCERFVGEAIESILAQSWVDFELLISDNGSADSTWSVLESWKMRDPRITLLRFSGRKSPGANRNYAMDHARGEWLTFLDADDIWTADRLGLHAEALRAAPNMIVCFADYRRFLATRDDAGPGVQAEVTKFFDPAASYVREVETLPSGVELFHLRPQGLKLLSCLVHCPMSTNVTSVRRETMLKSGIRFHEDWMINEDFHAWMQLLDLGQVAALNKPLAFYRENEDSLTSDEVRYYAGMAKSHGHWRKRVWKTLSPSEKKAYRRKIQGFYEAVAWLMSNDGNVGETCANAIRGMRAELTIRSTLRAVRMMAKAALLHLGKRHKEAK